MSADFSRYVDLTLYDSDPGALYRSTADTARLVLPEFNLRQGTVEDTIFQAFAYSSSIIVNAVNRLPSRLMEGLINMAGYERSVGTKPSAVLNITLYGYEGTTIPTGTQFRYRYVEPGTTSFEDYVFETIEDESIASTTSPTVPSGQVAVKSTTVGQIPALSAGDILLPLSVDTDINAVTVVSFVNGVEPMGDGEYLDAALTYLESLTEVFATANQLQNGILTTFTNVRRCKVYDVTNALASTSTSATAVPGYIAVYVYGNGAVLENDELSEIQTWAASRCMAGLVITVSNFILSAPTVTVDAVINSKYTTSDVLDEIKFLVNESFSYENFSQTELSVASPQIRANSIAAVVAQMPEVLYVNSVTLTPPAAVAVTAIRPGNSLSGSATGYVRFTAANSFVAGQEVDITTNINAITITAVDDGANLAGVATPGTIRFTADNSLTVGDIITIDCGVAAFDFTRAVVTNASSSYFTISSTATNAGLSSTGTAYYDFTNSTIIAANATDFVIANTCIASDAFIGRLNGTTTFTATGTSAAAAATYSGVSQSATSGSGSGAVFTIVKTGSGTAYSGAITVTVTYGGIGYAVGDTITISGAVLGGGGNLVLTVATSVNAPKTGSAYVHFDGNNSTSTSSLVFKNRGFLPNISSSGVSVTYSLEAI